MNAQTGCTVLADRWTSVFEDNRVIVDVALVIAGAALIVGGSRISFFLPYTPVPITLQTLAVLLIGVLLGSKRGALAAATYIIGGAAGLPVFTGGGCGLVRLAGPTGGYLLGFVVAAYITGRLAEYGQDRRVLNAAGAMVAGNFVIYLLGLPWLALYIGAAPVFKLGLLPFIPGDLLKIGMAAILLPGLWRFNHRDQ